MESRTNHFILEEDWATIYFARLFFMNLESEVSKNAGCSLIIQRFFEIIHTDCK